MGVSKRNGAYFTVEAALTLPIVIFVVLAVVYLLLFQYNSCLLEQDLGMVAVRAGSFSVKEEELETEVQHLVQGINAEKYIGAMPGELSVTEEGAGLRIKGELYMNGLGELPFKALSINGEYLQRRQQPVFVIRMLHKLERSLQKEGEEG